MKSFRLSPKEVLALKGQVRSTKSVFVLRRCLACLEAHRGRSISEIAALLQVTTRRVYQWLEWAKSRNGDVLEWISEDVDAGGRPSLWDEDLDSILEAALSHSPDQLGYGPINWTAALLRLHLKRWTGEDISLWTLRRHLHRLGYAWKRPRYSLVPDPLRSRKMAKIRAKVANLEGRYVLLFMDETDLLLFPPLRSTWSKRGHPSKVLLRGWNDKRVIFGAINVMNGNGLFISRQHNWSNDFIYFLKHLQWHYRGWKIYLLLDEHPSHTAVTSKLQARSMGINFIWLPKRSPELNPMETLWGKAKDALFSNRQFEDLDEQTDQFVQALLEIPAATLMKKSGLLSKHFWLWKK